METAMKTPSGGIATTPTKSPDPHDRSQTPVFAKQPTVKKPLRPVVSGDVPNRENGIAPKRSPFPTEQLVQTARPTESKHRSAEAPKERVSDDYVFDPDSEPPAEKPIFQGFLCSGDLVVWLGREKHRKTNVLLQFAICAALSRNFLLFQFAAHGPIRVVIVDYESKTGSLKRRYDAICLALGLSYDEKKLLKLNLQIIEVRRVNKKCKIIPRFPVEEPSKEDSKEKNDDFSFWKDFAKDYPADLYIFDPMRSMHTGDENDSKIEMFMSRLRFFFGDAAVIISHHMRKQGNRDNRVLLKDDMRLWSDGARGSVALKAHADVIVCQERQVDEDEIVYLGAFLKDGPDIDPVPLKETDAQSFLWQVSASIPAHLRQSFEALKRAGGKFTRKNGAIDALTASNVSRSTAYRHIEQLVNAGLLKEAEGQWSLQTPAVDNPLNLGVAELDPPQWTRKKGE